MVQVQFPPGEVVFTGRPFEEGTFAEVDRLLSMGYCPDGVLELETAETRLSCLMHRSLPHLAGLLEQGTYSWVPLREFPLRARQLESAMCKLVRSDPTRVFLAAVHFRNRPVLQASTDLVDLIHVLDTLAQEQKDAALALERSGSRTLLFLQKGIPTRLYFGNPREDNGQGNIRERFLAYALDSSMGTGKIEVFKKLNITPDPDAGTSLTKLSEVAKPPPPMSIFVRLGGRIILQRPFMPPAMVIGRDHACELTLDNLSVSRRHARLFWDRGQFFVEDLGSANGTLLNGKPVVHSVVESMDRIGLGKFELAMIEHKENLHPDRTLVMSPDVESHAYLVGDEISAPVSQEISIGKAPSVDVQARGFFVRPIHAKICPESSGAYRLICTGNLTVRVNGRKVRTSYLNFGDEIIVGRSRFWLVPSLSGEPTNV